MNEVLTESALPSIEEVDEALIALLIGAMNANDHVVDALLVKNRL